MLFLVVIYSIVLLIVQCQAQTQNISALAPNINGTERNLIGSNCILIERGDVPPYYDCLGCIIEQATGCINDMRNNKSSNVASACKMHSASEKYDRADCCPQYGSYNGGKDNLLYTGSAYPEALRCIMKAGCSTSTIYKQLEDECLAVCPGVDPRNKKISQCYSDFNSASFNKVSLGIVAASVMLTSLFFGVLS